MINKTLFNDIVNHFSNETSHRFILSNDKATEDEQEFVLIINEINKKYRLYTYDEIPYAFFLKGCCIYKHRDCLIDFSNREINSFLKFKLHDFIWIKFNEYCSAKTAFNGFVSIINSTDEYNQNYSLFNRCTNIYLKLNDESLSFEYQRTLYKMIDAGKSETGYRSIRILSLALEKDFLPAKELLSPIKLKFEQMQAEDDFSLFLEASEVYEKAFFKAEGVKYTNKQCKNKIINNIRRMRTDWYIKLFENSSFQPMIRVEWAKKAINQLKSIADSEDERRELQQKLYLVQSESLEQMHTFSHKVDISDVRKYCDAVSEKLDATELFYFFLLTPTLTTYKQAKDQMMETEGSMASKHLANEQLIDKTGKLIAIMPDWTKALQTGDDSLLRPHVERNCAELYRHNVNLCMNYLLDKVKSSELKIEVEVRKIIESSYFVPENRRKSFEQGLMCGFNFDFIAALNILAPQVENSIRQLALVCGDSIVKINDDYTEEYLSLDGLLNLPKLSECVDERALFNVSVIFNSKYGMNIRNLIAHGLFDDSDYSDVDFFFAWWMVLRLCLEFQTERSTFKMIVNLRDKLKDIDEIMGLSNSVE